MRDTIKKVYIKACKPVLITGTLVLITWLFLGDDIVFKFKSWLIEKLIYHAHENTLAFVAVLGVIVIIILLFIEIPRHEELKKELDELDVKFKEMEKLKEEVRENLKKED